MESLTHSILPRVGSQLEIQHRQNTLGEILEAAAKNNDIINENYLLYKMNLAGIQNYTRNKLYQDRLSLDSQNNYIRNFLPRYSKYQEDINAELDAIREECIVLSREDWKIRKKILRETPDGAFETTIEETGNQKFKADLLKIRLKVAELKQKHSEGQNINISAVIVQRELIAKKEEIEKLKNE